MPLNGNVLGTAISNALDGAPDIEDREALWQIACNEIVNHFIANAVISTTVSGNGLPVLPVQVVPATGTGATTAPDVITGTGTGTIA